VADLYSTGDQLELSHGFLDDNNELFTPRDSARQSVDRPIATAVIHRLPLGLGMGADDSRQSPPFPCFPEFGPEFQPLFQLDWDDGRKVKRQRSRPHSSIRFALGRLGGR